MAMISEFKFLVARPGETPAGKAYQEGVILSCKVCKPKVSVESAEIWIAEGELVTLFTRVSLHQHVGTESAKLGRPLGVTAAAVHNTITGDIAPGSKVFQIGHQTGRMDV